MTGITITRRRKNNQEAAGALFDGHDVPSSRVTSKPCSISTVNSLSSESHAASTRIGRRNW
jgi:hypothetical protein